MIDYENLQSRCQRGELSLCAANNLLAECRAAIGRLIAENERVETENETLRTEHAGLRTGFDAQNEVIAGLRKDAERYQWLRDSSESIHQFYLSTPIWFTGVKFSKENVDSTIDAAMGKGGSDGA